jgi:single-stranded-DNA-specific exonuclease
VLLDRILRQRGLSTSDELATQAKYLAHYQDLKGIDEAARLLALAVRNKQKICIVGDFDADGATSTALCILALRAMGHNNVDYIVPNRFDFGYGLTSPVVDIAHAQNTEVIITVDNGISSIEGVAHAKKLGMTVIVTDHHLPADELPHADAIVNPNQHNCGFGSKNLAGVGVAFYVMSALKNALGELGYFEELGLTSPNMANFLDIVAIGTVADVVPLDANNRILVHQGIARIRAGKTRPGVLALLNVTNRPYQRCCTTDIGFVIGPRLNAAGRLDDMSHGIECLLCDNATTAAQYAAELDGLNQSRREIEQSMRDDAERFLAEYLAKKASDKRLPPAIVLYQKDFHQGVVGIVAGRIKEKYYRPTFVFADEDEHYVKGSARSIDGVHIRDVLARIDALQPQLIKKFGGHAMAAGLSLAKGNLAEFESLLHTVVEDLTKGLPQEAIVYSDGELAASDINLTTANELKYAFPWGQKFEEPCFDGVFDIVNQRIVGQNHLKLTLANKGVYFDGIAFGVDTSIWPNLKANQVRIAYKLDINEFRGNVSVQLMINALESIE